MIVPMKKVTIACLSKEKQAAVQQLQRLGTVHVVPLAQPASEAMDTLRRQQEQLTKALTRMKALLAEAKVQVISPVQQEKPDYDGVLQAFLADMDAEKRITEELSQVRKAQAQLAPWGGFSRDQLEALEAHGLHTALCTASAKHLPSLPKDAVLKEVSRFKDTVYFVIFSRTPLDSAELPLATLPQNTSLNEWNTKEVNLKEQAKSLQATMLDCACKHYAALETFSAILDERLAFAKARDGMASSNAISFLRGYTPAEFIDQLRQTAQQNGWAIRYEDVPEDDMDAPTKLEIAKPFRMAQAIFDFVGILPGYHETDVSVSMLIFLSLFCGILVGDAGYGTLFTLVVLWLRMKVKDPQKRLGMNLLLTMSITILIYGALTCNWFAIPADKLPGWMNICPWMCNNDKHIQLLSFFIGAFHMSMAHAWCAIKAARTIKLSEDDTIAFLKKIREALGHIGWGLFLWANFGTTRLLVIKGGDIGDLEAPFVWLYIIGFIFILAFSIDWTDMGAVIYSPFGFINSFVDVLSYIRLFAVGLSGVYIANSFNGMAMGLHSLNMPIVTIPAAILILGLGHLLNIAMAFMSVLVHGIRLNTLEFSGHMGLNWAGKAYKPLQSKDNK